MAGSTPEPGNLPARSTRKNRTGERISAGVERVRSDHDIDTDRVADPEEAGLGSDLDEIDDAWLEKDRGEH